MHWWYSKWSYNMVWIQHFSFKCFICDMCLDFAEITQNYIAIHTEIFVKVMILNGSVKANCIQVLHRLEIKFWILQVMCLCDAFVLGYYRCMQNSTFEVSKKMQEWAQYGRQFEIQELFSYFYQMWRFIAWNMLLICIGVLNTKICYGLLLIN